MIWKFIRIIDINLCWTSAKMELEKDFLQKSTLLVKCQLLFLIRVKISCDSTPFMFEKSSLILARIHGWTIKWSSVPNMSHCRFKRARTEFVSIKYFPQSNVFPIKCFQCENCFQISDKIFLLSPVYLTATSIVQMLPKYKKKYFFLNFLFLGKQPPV